MIKLKVDPLVLARLTEAFPKANSASKALDKYVRILTRLLRDARTRGPDNFDRLFGLHSISVNTLQHRGSQIGPNRKRLHKWLEENDLALIQKVEAGDNIKKQLSRVRLTDLVDMEIYFASSSITEEMAGTVLQNQLTTNYPMTTDEFHEYFPDYITTPDAYDTVMVDQQSLANYIHWLNFKSTQYSAKDKEKMIEDAEYILKVASINGGLFPMLRNPSEFGRTYYKDINIQNVPKLMREAILGECWEYDVRSSVISWKMGRIAEIAKQHMDNQTFRKQFCATICYLEDKQDFMLTLQSDMLSRTGKRIDTEADMKKLKQAITAISFGARDTVCCWEFTQGRFSQRTAISGIFKKHDIAKAFLDSPTIKKFAAEQKLMDKCIIELVKQHNPDIALDPLFKHNSRFDTKKLMAYLYQHAETQHMNTVVDYLRYKGRDVLARIHDALIIREKLSTDDKYELELMMRDELNNQYWKLGHRHVLGFARYDPAKTDHQRSSANETNFIQVEARDYFVA
jgi:hypothetical protein